MIFFPKSDFENYTRQQKSNLIALLVLAIAEGFFVIVQAIAFLIFLLHLKLLEFQISNTNTHIPRHSSN